jgi:FtsP/CotA-like multicopper oxidase with cupredoxin domain
VHSRSPFQRKTLLTLVACACCLSPAFGQKGKHDAAPRPQTRLYFIAADEVEWDYAPGGADPMTGKPFEGMAKAYTERGPHRIGRIYRKALYREYSDGTFAVLKKRPAEEAYLGSLGPVLRGAVGDTIVVVFRNNGTHPFSMHPHGVFYLKNSEGAPYSDGTSGADKLDDAVPPGGTHTYVWPVLERSGPGPNDPSSLVWLYHSHTDEPHDVESGLIGAILVTARGKARPDGTPLDVDREFVTLFMAYNENQSWYLDYNIRHYATDPAGVNRLETIPLDTDSTLSLVGTGFGDVNFRFTINGFMFGTMPMMMMQKGDRVRWYLLTVGEGLNFHTPHWHGNTVLINGSRTDVVALSPAQMVTADMVPDNAGIWMYHCHISEHMEVGMMAHYHVMP